MLSLLVMYILLPFVYCYVVSFGDVYFAFVCWFIVMLSLLVMHILLLFVYLLVMLSLFGDVYFAK